METKTYGVMGYTDIMLEIPAGRFGSAHVHFTGGTMTAYGVTPAEYTTSDRLRQVLIENSPQYKEGRIKLLRATGSREDRRRGGGKLKPEAVQKVDIEHSEQSESSEREVKVSCLPEAQAYLRDYFGIPTSKSRSIERAQEFARENGIVFVGL